MYFNDDIEREAFLTWNCSGCRWQHINAGIDTPACSVWQQIDYEAHAFKVKTYDGVARICHDFTKRKAPCPLMITR